MSVEVMQWLRGEIEMDVAEAKKLTHDFVSRLNEEVIRLNDWVHKLTTPAPAPNPDSVTSTVETDAAKQVVKVAAEGTAEAAAKTIAEMDADAEAAAKLPPKPPYETTTQSVGIVSSTITPEPFVSGSVSSVGSLSSGTLAITGTVVSTDTSSSDAFLGRGN